MQGPLETIFSLIILMMSVVFHEVSHGYVAGMLGDPTAKYAGRLTLNPLKHLDFVGSFVVPVLTTLFGGITFGWAKPVPYNPYNLRGGRWGPAVVAASGPLANLFLAVFFSLILRSTLLAPLVSESVAPLLVTAIGINIVLFVVNIIPVPPIDGSKVLFSLLPYRYNFVIEFMEKYWLLLIFFIILFLNVIIAPLYNLLFSLLVG